MNLKDIKSLSLLKVSTVSIIILINLSLIGSGMEEFEKENVNCKKGDKKACEFVVKTNQLCKKGNKKACKMISDIKAECENNKKNACDNITSGEYFSDEKISKTYFSKACEKGSSRACALAGSIVEREEEVGGNAIKHYIKACDLNDGVGCFTAFQILYSGIYDDLGINKEFAGEYLIKGLPYLIKECEEGSYFSCYIYKNLITGSFNEYKSMISKSFPFEKLVQICESDQSINRIACEILGIYISEYSPTINGKQYDSEIYFSKHIDLYMKLCELKSSYDCLDFAKELYEGKNGIKDLDKALLITEKDCDLNKNAESCNYAGIINSEKENHKKAREYYQKGCNLKAGYSCNNLGSLWEAGQGGLESYEEAVKFYLKGAEFGNINSINSLGSLFYKLVESDSTDLGFGILLYSSRSKIDYMVESYKWFNIANALGNSEESEKFGAIKSRMNASQLLEAQKKSAEWLKKFGKKYKI